MTWQLQFKVTLGLIGVDTQLSKKQVNGEYDRYIHNDLFPCNVGSFYILNWWKMHASKYLILASKYDSYIKVWPLIYQSDVYYCMPGTTAHAEYLFSLVDQWCRKGPIAIYMFSNITTSAYMIIWHLIFFCLK